MHTIDRHGVLNRVVRRLMEDGSKTASSKELRAAANKMQKDVSSFNQAISVAVNTRQDKGASKTKAR